MLSCDDWYFLGVVVMYDLCSVHFSLFALIVTISSTLTPLKCKFMFLLQCNRLLVLSFCDLSRQGAFDGTF